MSQYACGGLIAREGIRDWSKRQQRKQRNEKRDLADSIPQAKPGSLPIMLYKDLLGGNKTERKLREYRGGVAGKPLRSQRTILLGYWLDCSSE